MLFFSFNLSFTWHSWFPMQGFLVWQGFWHFFWMHTKLWGQSLSIRHSGLGSFTAKNINRIISSIWMPKISLFCLTFCTVNISISFKRFSACTCLSVVASLTICTMSTCLTITKSNAPSGSTIASLSCTTVLILVTTYINTLHYWVPLLARRTIADTRMLFSFAKSLTSTWNILTRVPAFLRFALFWKGAVIVCQTFI